MYYAKHSQTGETTVHFSTPYLPMLEAEDLGWEECETVLMETVRVGVKGVRAGEAEFPCHYYGDYTCELLANKPDSLCPFHAGEED